MKKITDSRRLLGAVHNTTLKELNTLYKGLMKKHHPDRFPDEAEKASAEVESQKVIEAYKFLESIHPETHATNAEDLERSLASNIANWHYQHMSLHVTFGDGSVYEYFGVAANVYKKFVNTNGNTRFARRHIFDAFPFRRISGPKPADQA